MLSYLATATYVCCHLFCEFVSILSLKNTILKISLRLCLFYFILLCYCYSFVFFVNNFLLFCHFADNHLWLANEDSFIGVWWLEIKSVALNHDFCYFTLTYIEWDRKWANKWQPRHWSNRCHYFDNYLMELEYLLSECMIFIIINIEVIIYLKSRDYFYWLYI